VEGYTLPVAAPNIFVYILKVNRILVPNFNNKIQLSGIAYDEKIDFLNV